jgi:hypothetical protein
MNPRPIAPALPHGTLTEVLPGFYFVTGTATVPGPLPMRFTQAMTVIKLGERLVIVNSVRLGDEGLAQLDALGRVTDVIRLAANHGKGDPFYRERYGARVWALEGAPYVPGFDANAEPYFEPDVRFTAATTLPLPNARLHVFGSKPPEALLVLADHGGTTIAGDALQNMTSADPHTNWLGRLTMGAMGFFKPCNVGPGWLRQCKPPAKDLLGVLELPAFENLLPAHGMPVLGQAQQKLRPAIERAAQAMG